MAHGVANMLSGFFGGMGGCTVMGQAVIVLGDFVGTIRMAALVAVMIAVAIGSLTGTP